MEEVKEEFGKSEKETEVEETLETKEETTEETTEEETSTEKTQDTEESSKDDETEETVVDLEDAIDDDERSNERKRIDKLTAQKYQAEAREEVLKAELKALKDSKTESKHERIYSDAELDQAETNTINDVDKSETEKLTTMANINKERIKNVERKLESRYKKDKEETQVQQKQSSQAWDDVQFWYQKQIPSEYKDNPDFNVFDQKSKLFKMARELYLDKELNYGNNMLKAVTDAFFELIRSGSSKSETGTERKLKRKLAKEKRKTSFADTGFKKETSKVPIKKSKGKLDDYFQERKEGFKIPALKVAK